MQKSHALLSILAVGLLLAVPFAAFLLSADQSDAADYSTPTTIDIAPGMGYQYTPTFSLPEGQVTLTIHEQDGNWFSIVNGDTLSGTIGTTTGNYDVVLKATSKNTGQIAYQHIIFNVKNTLTITTSTLAPAIKGTAYNAQLQASLPDCSWSATNLPAGLSISSAGKITGTPTAVGDKSVVINVTATSPTQSASRTLLLRVVDSLSIGGPDTLHGAVGVVKTLTPTASLPGGTWSIASGSVPGLSINPSTGVLTLAPTAAIAEMTTATVTIKVVTGNPAQSATKDITVKVDPEMAFTSVPTADMIIYEV